MTTIGTAAFEQARLQTLVVGSGVNNIGSNAFAYNSLASVRFLGARPLTLGTNIFFSNPTLLARSVSVPAAHFNDFNTVATFEAFGLTTDRLTIYSGDNSVENGVAYR